MPVRRFRRQKLLPFAAEPFRFSPALKAQGIRKDAAISLLKSRQRLTDGIQLAGKALVGGGGLLRGVKDCLPILLQQSRNQIVFRSEILIKSAGRHPAFRRHCLHAERGQPFPDRQRLAAAIGFSPAFSIRCGTLPPPMNDIQIRFYHNPVNLFFQHHSTLFPLFSPVLLEDSFFLLLGKKKRKIPYGKNFILSVCSPPSAARHFRLAADIKRPAGTAGLFNITAVAAPAPGKDSGRGLSHCAMTPRWYSFQYRTLCSIHSERK